MVLHEWLASYSAFFEYPPKWCTYSAGMAGATWNCSHLGASSVYTTQPCSMSLHAKPHTYKVYACLAVTCHLRFWQNDRGLLRATAVTRGWTDTEIRVSTESRPWRRKFSRRSYRDLNPGPFSLESGALTTELSPSETWALVDAGLNLLEEAWVLAE